MKNQKKKTHPPKTKRQEFPPGWDETKIQKVLKHYENQTDDEAVAEDEAAFHADGETIGGEYS